MKNSDTVETMTDRIKLAEAMGWDNFIDGNDGHKWAIDPKAPPFDGSVQYMPHSRIPDPFTDANDDYAVLEWMRTHEKWDEFVLEMYSYIYEYQIGDYARAALKVLA